MQRHPQANTLARATPPTTGRQPLNENEPDDNTIENGGATENDSENGELRRASERAPRQWHCRGDGVAAFLQNIRLARRVQGSSEPATTRIACQATTRPRTLRCVGTNQQLALRSWGNTTGNAATASAAPTPEIARRFQEREDQTAASPNEQSFTYAPTNQQRPLQAILALLARLRLTHSPTHSLMFCATPQPSTLTPSNPKAAHAAMSSATCGGMCSCTSLQGAQLLRYLLRRWRRLLSVSPALETGGRWRVRAR
jgi:hypothetical protein